jgi:hypothetical protein
MKNRWQEGEGGCERVWVWSVELEFGVGVWSEGAQGGKGGGGPLRGGRWQGTGGAAGGGGGKGKRRKGQRTEITKCNSLTEDTPRDADKNALRLHLHNFDYKTFKKKKKKGSRVCVCGSSKAKLILNRPRMRNAK